MQFSKGDIIKLTIVFKLITDVQTTDVYIM